MKPTENIDLKSLQIRGIAANVRSWSFMIETITKEIESLQAKIDKVNQTLARIENGDWSLLAETHSDKQPE